MCVSGCTQVPRAVHRSQEDGSRDAVLSFCLVFEAGSLFFFLLLLQSEHGSDLTSHCALGMLGLQAQPCIQLFVWVPGLKLRLSSFYVAKPSLRLTWEAILRSSLNNPLAARQWNPKALGSLGSGLGEEMKQRHMCAAADTRSVLPSTFI